MSCTQDIEGAPPERRGGEPGVDTITRPVATFRPVKPRTDEWARQPVKPALDEIDLPAFQRVLEDVLASRGLPPECVSNYGAISAVCRNHSGSIRLTLSLPDGHRIRVTHCGCDAWPEIINPPPGDINEMAESLADEIDWYWHHHDAFMVMDPDVAHACQREAAKDRLEGLGTKFAGPKSIEFETFRGRDQATVAYIHMLDDSLLMQPWRRSLSTVRDVTSFFRAMRPYLRCIAERRDEYAELGATGAIDMLALASLTHLGIDPLEVIADLARSGWSSQFDIGGPRLLLRWRTRMICGAFIMPSGVDWMLGQLHTIADRDDYANLSGHGDIGAILSSPLLPQKSRLLWQRFPDWIEMQYPTGELFSWKDDKASWVHPQVLRRSGQN